ncbi:MAG: 4-(cytidine 5'-diphospho)-2-C-methyl-D-erythritol kinase [Lachnospiraceae bacterium]
MKEIEVRAYAKINLVLDVTGERPNGYHEVRMIMQNINLYDRLTLKQIVKNEVILSAGTAPVPVGNDNLICKACNIFFEETGISSGVFINLDKRIPVAAGMAGGSADAAAALQGLNELFDTGLSIEQLCEMGVKLGADVPFCIMGGTVLAEGIGEVLTPLSPAPDCHLLIVKPPVGISTKLVYDKLAPADMLDHPDTDAMLVAIKNGSIKDVAANLGNVLESVTIRELPFIDDIKKEMVEMGALGALMSGSGTTVFGIFDSKPKAEAAFYKFKAGEYGKQTYLTGFINP